MKERESLVGHNPFYYKIDQTESFDINTNHDFEVAEILFKNSNTKGKENFKISTTS